MKVLKATQSQYEEINGYCNDNNIIEFVLDADGNYILGVQNRANPAFEGIQEQLEALEEIDFNPVKEALE